MKKIFAIILLTILISTLVACQNISKPSPQSININSKDFKIVDLQGLAAAQFNTLQELKTNRGYIYWQEEEDFYILIFAGEKPTGGYRIDIKSIEDHEGKTNILINVLPPQQLATQAISYPYIVVKTTGITDNFNIEDTNGEIYSQLSQGVTS